jgi:HAE1 family hydrophobic/amphiphilic exporter-1
MARYANKIAAETTKIPGAVDVDTSLNLGKPEVQVALNRPKAADLGVQVADVAGALRWLVGGDEVTTYNEGGEQYEVHLRARAEDRASQGAVGQFTVPSSRLGSIPLENLALVQRGEAPTQIDRYQRQRQVTVLTNLLPGYSQTPVMAAMQNAATRAAMPTSYKTTFVGQSREMGRAATNFLLAFGLSLVFMYLILAAQFESWLHPITILLSLPLTLPFAIFSLVIVGQSMNIMSALGLFVLFGVVKKNSILQIDKANQLMAEGKPAHEAVLEACRLRLRPILMTTAAFVAGMVPLVVSGGVGAGTNRSIGFVIIGGQSLALLLTLVATPVAYSLFDDVRRHFGKRSESAMKVGAISVIVVVAITALASSAAAQDAPPKGNVTRGPMRLTLDDAVRLALQNNLDIAVDRFEPQAATQKAAQASAAFKPSFASVFASTHQVQAPANLLVNAGGTTTDAFTSTLGVGQRLPWAGTTYSVGWNAVRTTTNSFFNSFSPGITSQLVVSFSQPLARDLSLDAARQQLIVTKRNQAITDTRFRETVVRTLADVKKAYWNLVAARALVDVQQKSLDLAKELVRTNTSRVEVGQSPPLDLLSAKAEQAQREENLVQANVAAKQTEDALRLLIFDPNDTSFWDVAVDPADTTPINVPVPDLDAIVKRALENRQDLIRARLDVANAETSVKYYKSQRLPDLRLQGSYGASGLGGTRWIRTGGFPGTIAGSEDTGFGTVLNQLFDRNWPNWSFGFSFSYPIGYSYEKAGLANARIQESQARLRLESAETKAVRQLRQAAWQLEATQKRIDTSRAAREFQAQRLDAEQKRYEVGMSTSFLVIQAQRDVVQASNNVLVAALEYVRAVIDFEALQEAGPAASSSGSSMAVSGGSVVALPVSTGISALGSSSRIGGM